MRTIYPALRSKRASSSTWGAGNATLTAIRAMSANTFLQISTAAPSTVAPSPTPAGSGGSAAVVLAYSGGCVIPAVGANPAKFVIHGGGHGDYAGNEVYVFDLSTFEWSLPIDATASGDVVANSEAYNDGNPVSCHTYNICTHDRVGNLITLGRPGYYSLGNSFSTVWRANLAGGTNTWTQLSANSAYTGDGFSASAAAAVHTGTGSIYALYVGESTSNLSKYDIGSGWTLYGQNNVFQVTALAIDTDNNWLVGYQSDLGDGIAVWDIANQPENPSTPTVTGTPHSGSAGLVFREADGKFYSYDGGTTVKSFTPSKTAITVSDNTGTGDDPGSGSANGTYGRFDIWQEEDVAILLNLFTGHVYAYKFPAVS